MAVTHFTCCCGHGTTGGCFFDVLNCSDNSSSIYTVPCTWTGPAFFIKEGNCYQVTANIVDQKQNPEPVTEVYDCNDEQCPGCFHPVYKCLTNESTEWTMPCNTTTNYFLKDGVCYKVAHNERAVQGTDPTPFDEVNDCEDELCPCYYNVFACGEYSTPSFSIPCNELPAPGTGEYSIVWSTNQYGSLNWTADSDEWTVSVSGPGCSSETITFTAGDVKAANGGAYGIIQLYSYIHSHITSGCISGGYTFIGDYANMRLTSVIDGTVSISCSVYQNIQHFETAVAKQIFLYDGLCYRIDWRQQEFIAPMPEDVVWVYYCNEERCP